VLLARPILRPAGSRRYLFKFQHSAGHRPIDLASEVVLECRLWKSRKPVTIN
jgi:hypothetical protein